MTKRKASVHGVAIHSVSGIGGMQVLRQAGTLCSSEPFRGVALVDFDLAQESP